MPMVSPCAQVIFRYFLPEVVGSAKKEIKEELTAHVRA